MDENREMSNNRKDSKRKKKNWLKFWKKGGSNNNRKRNQSVVTKPDWFVPKDDQELIHEAFILQLEIESQNKRLDNMELDYKTFMMGTGFKTNGVYGKQVGNCFVLVKGEEAKKDFIKRETKQFFTEFNKTKEKVQKMESRIYTIEAILDQDSIEAAVLKYWQSQ